MLLDLPPEILEMMILALPPDTFIISLSTCKTIRYLALASQKVLRTQMMRLPGLRISDRYYGCITKSKHGAITQAPDRSEDLLSAIKSRARACAFDGVDVFADILVYEPSIPTRPTFVLTDHGSYVKHEFWTRPRLNLIQPCCPKGCDRGALVAAADSDGRIQVFRIRKGTISPMRTFDPRSLGMEDGDEDNDVTHPIKYKCEQMCWQRGDDGHIHNLVAVFSHSLEGEIRDGQENPANRFMREAVVRASLGLKLCVWNLPNSNSRPAIFCDVDVLPYERPQIIVAADAQSSMPSQVQVHSVAIISRVTNHFLGADKMSHQCHYKIAIVSLSTLTTKQINLKCLEDDQKNCTCIKFPYPVTHARFTSASQPELYIYGPGTMTIATVLDVTNTREPTLRLPNLSLREEELFSSSAAPTAFGGIPIKAKHGHEVGTYENGSKYCVQTILELVMPGNTKTPGAFLVKYAQEQDECNLYDLSMPLPALEYTTVAKLLNSDDPRCPPQHRVVAHHSSAGITRVAIAFWNVLKVWDINPDAFLDPKVGSLMAGPEGDDLLKFARMFTEDYAGPHNQVLRCEFGESVDEDKAYTTNCGQGYWHDYIRISGKQPRRIVGIRPITLPSRGVVHSMAWAGKNRLWAWTDRGLVKWSWGKGRSATRETLPLSQVPENMWS